MNLVVRAAQFERTGLLQILQFQINRRADHLGKRRTAVERRGMGDSRESCRGLTDRLNRQAVVHIEDSFRCNR